MIGSLESRVFSRESWAQICWEFRMEVGIGNREWEIELAGIDYDLRLRTNRPIDFLFPILCFLTINLFYMLEFGIGSK